MKNKSTSLMVLKNDTVDPFFFYTKTSKGIILLKSIIVMIIVVYKISDHALNLESFIKNTLDNLRAIE